MLFALLIVAILFIRHKLHRRALRKAANDSIIPIKNEVRENLQTIQSKFAGQLKEHPRITGIWEGGEVTVPLFNNQVLPVEFFNLDVNEDPKFLEEADRALGRFLTLDLNDRSLISPLVLKDCINFLNSLGIKDEHSPYLIDYNIDKNLLKIKDPDEIWDFIEKPSIGIERRQRPRGKKDVYITIYCECEWEDEHGLQFVFRQGSQLTRVSRQDGWLTTVDAQGKSESEDKPLITFDVDKTSASKKH